jgi:hypothetical protein
MKKTKAKKIEALKVGDRVWVTGKSGTITSFIKDGYGQRVPWIKCDDGECWDARDVSSIYRIPTLQKAAQDVIEAMRRPGFSYQSIAWEVAIQWLERAVAEDDRRA